MSARTQTTPSGSAGRPPEPAGVDGARPQAPENFRDRFCKANQCAPHEFADRVFLRTLHFPAVTLAPLLWPWRRWLFAEDFALIEKVATAQWRGDVAWKIERMRNRTWSRTPGYRFLRWRISTRRLGMLMGKVMGSSERGTPLPEAVPKPTPPPTCAEQNL